MGFSCSVHQTRAISFILIILSSLVIYLWTLAKLVQQAEATPRGESQLPVAGSVAVAGIGTTPHRLKQNNTPVANTTTLPPLPAHRTKIVGFINEAYLHVGMRWYDRLTALGYTEHVIIATDNQTSSAFQRDYPHYRIEASFRPPLPPQFWTLKFGKKMRKEVEMLFAYRWVYLLEQLKAGYHILLTDVDNIFSKYHPMSNFEQSKYNVFHALETKHPTAVFDTMGFVVCGGMGWYRSTPGTIQFIQRMVDRCGDRCDDQIILNKLLAEEIQWALTDWHKSFRTIHPNHSRLDGLLTRGFSGVSTMTSTTEHHTIMVWDRDFAYRGENDPTVCPVENWVSMPFVTYTSRWEGGNAKYKSYDVWDKSCPNDYSNRMAQTKKDMT